MKCFCFFSIIFMSFTRTHVCSAFCSFFRFSFFFWVLMFSFRLSFHFVCRLDFASSVQVNFEKPDSGFFFKHSAVQSNNNNNPIVDIKNNPIAAKENQDSILSFNRFTVAQANHPVSIRASYGPFSTKQTVPARYIVPEDATDNYGSHTQVSKMNRSTWAWLIVFEFCSGFAGGQ